MSGSLFFQMKTEGEAGILNMMGNFSIPQSTLELIVRSVEISSYLPGRTRLHSRKMINNPGLEQQVKARLSAFAEIEQVETNTLTGSILIRYTPEILRRNAELRRVEDYIRTHVRR